MSDDGSWEGRSSTSFADAAKEAVRKAEADHGREEPTTYDVTLQVVGDPGMSLSEYIVVLRIHD